MKVLIVGHVKTGTTALYTIIKAALPQAHGAFEPQRLGFEAAHRQLVTKYIHLRNFSDAAGNYDKRIVIVRDGFDSLISWLFFAPSLKRGFSDDKNARGYLQRIEMLRAGKMDFRDLGKLASYLDLNLEASQKPLPHLGERVARSQKTGNWKRSFSPEDFRQFDQHYNGFHAHYGYRLSEGDLLPRNITRAESTDFVLAGINAFRKAKHLPPVGARPDGFAGGLAFEKALTWFNRGGQRQACLEKIDRAIAAQSDIAGYHLLRSKILGSLNREAEALVAIERALELSPQDARPALMAARAELEQGGG